jgi:hypothetical protein
MPDHLRCDRGLVDEDKPLCIELGLLGFERSTLGGNVRTILLRRAQRFF